MTGLFMQFSFLFSLAILLCIPSFSKTTLEKKHNNIPKHNKFRQGTLSIPSGETIFLNLKFSEKEQTLGLSGVKASQFKDNKGAFFFYSSDGPRQFWMPDTYFNLDIIFLDKNFKILHISKNMKAHSGFQPIPPISKTPIIWARHVLEIKSSTKISKKLSTGMQLIWTSSYPLSEIESNIHLLQ